MRRTFALALPLLVTLGLSLWRSHGPAPVAADASGDLFSAERAFDTIRDLVGDESPHPIGTPRNQAVRSLIESRFRSLGYETVVQRRFACNWSAVCGTVENVIARRPGPATPRAVLLVAHYDSVLAGPGATDDAMGVAALLETARALRTVRSRNDIVFLITDGEEAGLLGAEAFVADEALSGNVAVVVNVENRGTWGASNLFETSRGNRWIIERVAPALKHPQGSSLFYEIYNLLPNDTDLTVFKRAGMAGVNFAAIRGVNWYHTPLDDVQHASIRTLQHHGENLLASASALAQADLTATKTSDATHFDLLGFFYVWWPQGWTLWIAIVSLIALLGAAASGRAGAEDPEGPPYAWRGVLFGGLAALVIIVLAALGGAGTAWISRLGSRTVSWVAYPQAAIAAMWLIGLASAAGGAALVRRFASPLALLHGIAIVWHVIAIALAVTIPGASYLFLVPAAAVSLSAWARAGAGVTATIATTVASLFLFPLALLLYEALGAGMMAAVAVVIALLAMLATPVIARARLAGIAALMALLAALGAAALPAWSADRPGFISLAWIDDSAATAPLWVTGTPTGTLRQVADFKPGDPSLTPWSRAPYHAAPAPAAGLERVSLTAQRSEDRIRIQVRSLRGAERVVLLFRGGSLISVNGLEPAPLPERRSRRSLNGWSSAVVQTGGAMTVELTATGTVEAVASDLSAGLPPSGKALMAARDASPGIPVHDGDVTITRVRARWDR